MHRAIALLCLVIALAATGCGGWYLRGTGPDAGKIKNLYLISNNAMQIAGAFRNELYYNSITSVFSREKADVVVELANENFERRTLSVDPVTGKVREIELTLEVTVSVRGPGGKLLVNNQKMSWVEDFVFDEISVLGTEAQEVTTKLELGKTAARALVLRLETLDFTKVEPEPKPKATARAKPAR
jgi:outer membrane lipopolysaccharide assembly protein LptE/RlpB